ncbi:MAG TPA: glycogen-binding domain-containing protein [Gemmatimonadaceae bacterium]
MLDETEKAELQESGRMCDLVVRAIPAEPLPELAPAVLQRIRSRQPDTVATFATAPRLTPRRTGMFDWLWRPRPVAVAWRPAYGLAAAVLLAVVVIAKASRPDQGLLPGPSQVLTQFMLNAPDAREVSLAGDFTSWQPAYTMTRSEQGVWTVVVPLDPGIHQYSFVVDGERWVPDPSAPAVNDGFGGLNSRIAVLTPDARKL